MNGYRSLLAALLALGVAGCGGAGDEAAEVQENVTVLGPGDVAVAVEREVAAGVALTGSLEPYRIAEVKAQVPGVVAGLAVDRGSSVAAGAVLARIEAEGIRSQAAGAASGVASAQAQLGVAQRNLESARTLHGAGALSDLEMRGAEAQFQVAQAQLAAARSQATGASEQAGRTVVRAPFAGQVSARQVNDGEAVNPGATLVTLVNSQFLELRGQVPVDQASRVAVGQPAEFALTAHPGRTFSGTVARVDPVADPGTRQVGVTLRLPNEDGALIAGMFATGRVVTGGGTRAVVVPVGAVRTAGTPHVLVVAGDSVVRRPVTLGDRDDAAGVVAVLSGVAAGERVIVSPGTVPEGTRVRLREPAAAPAAESGGVGNG